jgi:hypothetical protein
MKISMPSRVLLLYLLFIASVLRLIGLGDEPLSFDEGYTLAYTSPPFVQMIKFIMGHDVHPPLYYVVVKFFRCFGGSEFLLRFPSAVCGVMAVWVLWSLVRENWGMIPAFGAAAVLAASQTSIWYSQEARMYSMIILFTALSLKFFLKFLSPGYVYKRRDAAGLILSNAALLYTHNVTIFWWIAQGTCMLAWICIAGIRAVRSAAFKRWLGCQFVILVVYLPWMCVFLSQATNVKSDFWLDRPDVGTVISTVNFVFSYESRPILAPLLLVCLISVLLKRRDVRVIATAGCIILPIALCYLYSITLSPIMLPRVLVYVAVPFFALFGLVLPDEGSRRNSGDRYFRRRLFVGLVPIGALICVNALSWHSEQMIVSRDGYDRAAGEASLLSGRDAAIVFTNPVGQAAFDYYFSRYDSHGEFLEVALPAHYLEIPGPRSNLEPRITEESIVRLDNALAGKRLALLVMSHYLGTDPGGLVTRYFDKSWTLSKRVELVEIELRWYAR